MPPRRAQAASSPTPTERSIAPSDSASNPPTQRLASATHAPPKSTKRPAKGRASMHVKHDSGDVADIKPDVEGPRKKVKAESAGLGAGGSKSRVAVDAKRVIAEEIISRGVASLDVAALAAKTGLSTQQVRSQIADNRNNLRRQLVLVAQALQ